MKYWDHILLVLVKYGPTIFHANI